MAAAADPFAGVRLANRTAQAWQGKGTDFNQALTELSVASGVFGARADDIGGLITSLNQLMTTFQAKPPVAVPAGGAAKQLDVASLSTARSGAAATAPRRAPPRPARALWWRQRHAGRLCRVYATYGCLRSATSCMMVRSAGRSE